MRTSSMPASMRLSAPRSRASNWRRMVWPAHGEEVGRCRPPCRIPVDPVHGRLLDDQGPHAAVDDGDAQAIAQIGVGPVAQEVAQPQGRGTVGQVDGP